MKMLTSKGRSNVVLIIDINIQVGGSGDIELIRTDGLTMTKAGSAPGGAHYVLFPSTGVTQYNLHITPQLIGTGPGSASYSITQNGKPLQTIDENDKAVALPETLTGLTNYVDNPYLVTIGLK